MYRIKEMLIILSQVIIAIVMAVLHTLKVPCYRVYYLFATRRYLAYSRDQWGYYRCDLTQGRNILYTGYFQTRKGAKQALREAFNNHLNRMV